MILGLENWNLKIHITIAGFSLRNLRMKAAFIVERNCQTMDKRYMLTTLFQEHLLKMIRCGI